MPKKSKSKAPSSPSRPAKAGRRKAPINKGAHMTTPEMRKEGRYLSSLGVSTSHLRKQKNESVEARNKRVSDSFKVSPPDYYNYPDASYEQIRGFIAANEAAEHQRLMKRRKELEDGCN